MSCCTSGSHSHDDTPTPVPASGGCGCGGGGCGGGSAAAPLPDPSEAPSSGGGCGCGGGGCGGGGKGRHPLDVADVHPMLVEHDQLRRIVVSEAAKECPGVLPELGSSIGDGLCVFDPDRGDVGLVAGNADGQILGAAWAVFDTPGLCSPSVMVYVDHPARGRGAGKELLTALLGIGRNSGWTGVRAAAAPGSAAALFLKNYGSFSPAVSVTAEEGAEPDHMAAPLTPQIDGIAVYCGSQVGDDPVYKATAQELGRQLAARGVRLVFGGGKVGLMGVVADAVVDAGGTSIGVITQYLKDKEIGHPGLTRLEVTDTMAARKTRMIELADAFVALPGGTGTLEELSEVLTNVQLVAGAGPVALLNVNDFWRPLVDMIDTMVAHGFVHSRYRQALIVADSVDDLFAQLDRWVPPGPKFFGGHRRID